MSKDVITLDQEQTVGEAVDLIDSRRIGSVVITQSGRPVGIFTERDIIRVVRLFRLSAFKPATEGEDKLSNLKLREVMSKPLVTTYPDASITNAFDLMVQKKVHHLPVIDVGRPVGLLAERDVLRAKGVIV